MSESEGRDGLPESPPELSPGLDAAVRDLLADAADTVPLPPDVGARLDETLASLLAGDQDEPAEDTVPADNVWASPVSPIAAARRRRRWPTLLVGAAAVTLFGYFGLGILTGSPDHVVGSGSAESNSAADFGADSAEAGSADGSGGAAQKAPEALSSGAGHEAKSAVPTPSIAAEPEAGAPAYNGPTRDLSASLHDLGADLRLLGQALGRDTRTTDGSGSSATGSQRCAPARGEYDWSQVADLDGERIRLVARTTHGVRILEAWPCTYAFVPSATVFLGR